MKVPSRLKAVFLASLVAFIWSTSWILIKFGLGDVPALTFAGLRYSLAFVCLTPFLFQRAVRDQIRSFTRTEWMLVLLMGGVNYFISQGSQFLSLSYLPATTLSLILNLSSVLVAILASTLIHETPAWYQWLGVLLNLAGVIVFFHPAGLASGSPLGYLFAIVCLAANTTGTLIGRKVNANGRTNPFAVTIVSMGIGAALLLGSGLTWQGLPEISTRSMVIICILAVINTAFTFVCWNYSLQTLPATESSIINNTMMIYITILAWIFLDEVQDVRGIIGLLLAFVGAVIVNLNFKRQKLPSG